MIIFTKGTYLRKFLMSYFIIFFIPFLLFTFIFQFKYKKLLQDQLIENNIKHLSSIQRKIDYELQQINMIVYQNIYTKALLPFDFTNKPLTAIDRMNTLSQYTETNNFIEELILYYNNSNFIYSSKSSHILPRNFYNIYNFHGWPLENFINDLNNQRTIKVIPRIPVEIYTKTNIDNYTLIIYPLTLDGIRHYGSLIFMINEKTFMDIINSFNSTNNNLTVILDDNNSVIAKQSNLKEEEELKILKHINNNKYINNSKIIDIEGIKYLVTFSNPTRHNWRIINFTSVDAALQVVVDTQKQFLLISFLILIAELVIITIFLRLNYKPISKLSNLSTSVLKNNSNNNYNKENTFKTYNEIASIEHALTYLSEENLALSEVIDDTKIASKAYIISQLLSGQVMKTKYMDSSLIKKVLNPDLSYYFSCIINISQEEQLWSDMKFELISDIESYSNEDIAIMCKESVVPNSITCLVLHKDTYCDKIGNLLETILSDLSEKWKADVTIGVGKTYTSLSELPKSFMGASTAIDYRLMFGNGSVIYYKDIIDNMKKISTYPYGDLEKFKLYIKKGNVKEIDKILNNLVKQFSTNTIPLFVARGICYEIINSVINSYEELGMDYEKNFEKYPDIFSITKYESISKIIEVVKLISYDVCKALSNTYDNDNKIIISNMNDYIKDNYVDPNFSLQSMADHFNTLPSNLSSFYKENTNNNIFEVVTELRMNAAKDLLINSKLPVNQICTKIGYDNVSSFIRRFKQFYNLTPGQYRNLYGKKQ